MVSAQHIRLIAYFFSPSPDHELCTRVSAGRDVPGQKHFLVPVSLCPGTRAGANVLGQTPLSRDVLGQNHLPLRSKNRKKDVLKQEKGCFKTEKGCSKTGK